MKIVLSVLALSLLVFSCAPARPGTRSSKIEVKANAGSALAKL
jgi:hypothetical protein